MNCFQCLFAISTCAATERDEDGNKITSAGAELAVGMEVEAHDPAADAAADALNADLNEGGCAGEMHLVAGPYPPPNPILEPHPIPPV